VRYLDLEVDGGARDRARLDENGSPLVAVFSSRMSR